MDPNSLMKLLQSYSNCLECIIISPRKVTVTVSFTGNSDTAFGMGFSNWAKDTAPVASSTVRVMQSLFPLLVLSIQCKYTFFLSAK